MLHKYISIVGCHAGPQKNWLLCKRTSAYHCYSEYIHPKQRAKAKAGLNRYKIVVLKDRVVTALLLHSAKSIPLRLQSLSVA